MRALVKDAVAAKDEHLNAAIASQQASGYAVWGRDTDHIEKGFVFGGMPARNGVTAALLVRSGWNGVDDVFSGTDNFFQVNAPKGDPQNSSKSSASATRSSTPTSRSGPSGRRFRTVVAARVR